MALDAVDVCLVRFYSDFPESLESSEKLKLKYPKYFSDMSQALFTDNFALNSYHVKTSLYRGWIHVVIFQLSNLLLYFDMNANSFI